MAEFADKDYGIWGVFCRVTDYPHDPVATVKGFRPDTGTGLFKRHVDSLWFNDYLDEAARHCERDYGRTYDCWDDIPDNRVSALLDPANWEVRPIPSLYRSPDGSPAIFVNVYEAGQAYGGPEEGGWWFETADPVCSYMVTDGFTAAMNLRTKLEREEYPDRGERYSARPRWEDYIVVIELDPPEASPAERPRYE